MDPINCYDFEAWDLDIPECYEVFGEILKQKFKLDLRYEKGYPLYLSELYVNLTDDYFDQLPKIRKFSIDYMMRATVLQTLKPSYYQEVRKARRLKYLVVLSKITRSEDLNEHIDLSIPFDDPKAYFSYEVDKTSKYKFPGYQGNFRCISKDIFPKPLYRYGIGDMFIAIADVYNDDNILIRRFINRSLFITPKVHEKFHTAMLLEESLLRKLTQEPAISLVELGWELSYYTGLKFEFYKEDDYFAQNYKFPTL